MGSGPPWGIRRRDTGVRGTGSNGSTLSHQKYYFNIQQSPNTQKTPKKPQQLPHQNTPPSNPLPLDVPSIVPRKRASKPTKGRPILVSIFLSDRLLPLIPRGEPTRENHPNSKTRIHSKYTLLFSLSTLSRCLLITPQTSLGPFPRPPQPPPSPSGLLPAPRKPSHRTRRRLDAHHEAHAFPAVFFGFGSPTHSPRRPKLTKDTFFRSFRSFLVLLRFIRGPFGGPYGTRRCGGSGLALAGAGRAESRSAGFTSTPRCPRRISDNPKTIAGTGSRRPRVGRGWGAARGGEAV